MILVILEFHIIFLTVEDLFILISNYSSFVFLSIVYDIFNYCPEIESTFLNMLLSFVKSLSGSDGLKIDSILAFI